MKTCHSNGEILSDIYGLKLKTKRPLLAVKGEIVQIISQHDNVYIVDNGKERFPVKACDLKLLENGTSL